MEQPDVSILQLFNMLPNVVPQSLHSRMTAFAMDSFRKTITLQAPPLPLRRSRSANIRGTQSEPASTTPSRPESMVSDAESDLTDLSRFSDLSASTLYSTSTLASSSSNSSAICSSHQRRHTMHERLQEEPRLPSGFNENSFDDTNLRFSRSGIKWRYARQGAQLTTCASEEMRDADFERRSYIDGVAYFLKACPDNLTELETDIFLRSAPWLADRQWPERRMALRRPTDRGSTILRRAVQYVTMVLVVLAHAAWITLLGIGRVGTYYEKQYNIGNQILTHGSVVANAVGKHSMVISERMSSMSDGKVGQSVSRFAAWTVDSFTGGVSDGYGAGIVMINRRPQVVEVK